jgi:hypothetical protein
MVLTKQRATDGKEAWKHTEARRQEVGGANPFVDLDGYKKFVRDKEEDFRSELAKQRRTPN